MRTVDPVKHEEKRGEILAAAERCFARNGFHAATIAQICEEARISPGHLYHYFANKEAIVGAITRKGLDYATARFAEISEDQDPIKTLIAEFERIRSLTQKPESGVHLDVLAEAARDPGIGAILREISGEMRRLMAQFLRDGQGRGQIDPGLDAEAAAAILISLIDSCKTLSIRDPGIDGAGGPAVFDMMITRLLSPPAISRR